jgi:arylsulfatase A-like enzyme
MRGESRQTRREFLGTAAGAAALALLRPVESRLSVAQPPNILFILADDLGYGDLSSFGRPDYRTPIIDRLGREGMRLTSVYTAAAVCTPTRVALMTGRYPARLPIGLVEPLAYGDMTVGIPPEHPTLASLVKKVGYDTALVGKWHLGYLPEHSPTRHGFDEFYGILSGGVDYFTHTEPTGKLDLHEGDVTVEQTGYMTDLLTDRAVAYLRRRRTRPFYLALHYTAPHWPWEGPTDSHGGPNHPLQRFTDGGSAKMYASMMQSLDRGVGRVLEALRASGRERDTIVVFTSDNGGERWSYTWPMSEGKSTLREGGIRVPGMVRWPGVISPGRSSAFPLITMDWTTTLTALAGASADPNYPLDGLDLSPLLRSGRWTEPQRTLFWRTRAQSAARRGQWKLWRSAQPGSGVPGMGILGRGGSVAMGSPGPDSLFDVVADPSERADLAAYHPDVLAALKGEYDAWNATMLPLPQAPSRATAPPG